jgi:hypothetical protein
MYGVRHLQFVPCLTLPTGHVPIVPWGFRVLRSDALLHLMVILRNVYVSLQGAEKDPSQVGAAILDGQPPSLGREGG